ncbi:MAG: hypothetical protein HY459_00470 [Parcubacteria group bacterium]|nr:hypothetical protein [Parcubacteria group bacterium]
MLDNSSSPPLTPRLDSGQAPRGGEIFPPRQARSQNDKRENPFAIAEDKLRPVLKATPPIVEIHKEISVPPAPRATTPATPITIHSPQDIARLTPDVIRMRVSDIVREIRELVRQAEKSGPIGSLKTKAALAAAIRDNAELARSLPVSITELLNLTNQVR